MKSDKLGWIVAAALAGAMFGMGFQASAPKFATVDMPKVFEDADLTKSGTSELKDFYQSRLSVIRFLKENPPMLPADADKYSVLALKTPQSADDAKELKRIEADAVAATQKQQAISLQKNPTPEDLKLLDDYRSRAEQNRTIEGQLEQKYDADTQDTRVRLHDQAMDKVKQAVADIAKKQGYTVVFSSEAAPYAANDLTADAEKAVGGKK